MAEFIVVADALETDAVELVLFNQFFSTSQTLSLSLPQISPSLQSEIDFEIEQSFALQKPHCARHAPTIYYVDGAGRARLVEGCCNSWECPRCGQIRARHEYTTIVCGADGLEKGGYKLYFWTFTCRGKEMPLEEAERDYQLWSNRVLTASRAKARRATKSHEPEFWAYAGVTERQKRGHPHSHLLTTYCPSDAKMVEKGDRRPDGRAVKHDVMWSDWFNREVVKAGLGNECEISPVKSAAGAASYISKYLFKETIAESWPKNWRRVRYSQNYPRLPQTKNKTAIPLIKHADWLKIENLAPIVYADSEYTYERALGHGVYNVAPPR